MSDVRNVKVSPPEREALLRLLRVSDGDTGQSRKDADFILAWWNAESCGKFYITDAWGLDAELAHDVSTVFALAVRSNSYPDTLGFADEFKKVVRGWRPDLAKA
jgi:hypothetical protein